MNEFNWGAFIQRIEDCRDICGGAKTAVKEAVNLGLGRPVVKAEDDPALAARGSYWKWNSGIFLVANSYEDKFTLVCAASGNRWSDATSHTSIEAVRAELVRRKATRVKVPTWA